MEREPLPTLWDLLETALPPARRALLRLVAREAVGMDMAAYLVGGFVRDLLLGRPSLDFDVVLEGWAPKLARHLARTFGGRVQTHARFGTAKWWLPSPNEPFWQRALKSLLPLEPADYQDLPPFLDLVTARRERYPHSGALPETEPADIHADLARRDFTINAMAFALTGPKAGRLLDPFHGLEDLRAKVLRALHPQSFVEDPTRMARGARYAARYGFHMSEDTARQIPSALAVVPEVSGDRWRHELDHILDEDTAAQALDLLAQWGVLEAIHPALPQGEEDRRRVALWKLPSPDWGLPDPWDGLPLARAVRYGLWFLETPGDGLRAVDARLHFPGKLRNLLQSVVTLWATREDWADLTPGPLTLHLEVHPLPAVYAVYLALSDAALRERLAAFATRWRHIPAPITGHDLKALGLPPGPAYKDLLRRARIEAIEGRLTTREDALSWLHHHRRPPTADRRPPTANHRPTTIDQRPSTNDQ